MTELELYKFIKNNNIEYHSNDMERYINDIAFYIFIPFYLLGDFTKLLGSDYISDSVIECCLKDNYIGLRINEICEYFDINCLTIFEKH